MKTQAELWAEYERLKEAEEYEAAGRLLDLIEPISREEFNAILDAAPFDDEPLSPEVRKVLDEAHAALARIPERRVG